MDIKQILRGEGSTNCECHAYSASECACGCTWPEMVCDEAAARIAELEAELDKSHKHAADEANRWSRSWSDREIAFAVRLADIEAERDRLRAVVERWAAAATQSVGWAPRAVEACLMIRREAAGAARKAEECDE
jgi:hypothetical protein